MRKTYDFCVIGSGASAATATMELVQSGASVCVLEWGDLLGRNASYRAVVSNAEPALVERRGKWEPTGYPWSTCNVGGGTLFYGGASFRLRDLDFDCSKHIDDDLLPVMWPIGSDQLSEHYQAVERQIGVSGSPMRDPTNPTEDCALLPPHEPDSISKLLANSAEQLGLNPFPTPLAVRSRSNHNGEACDYSKPCIENYCLCAKGDAVSSYWQHMWGKRNLDFFSGVKACEFHTQKNRAVSVDVVEQSSNKHSKIFAKSFLLAANAAQSAAILWRSKSPSTGISIGNEKGILGRGLCVRPSLYVEGKIEIARVPEIRKGGPFSYFSVLDFYEDEECPTGLGGVIYEARAPKTEKNGSYARVRLECMIGDRPCYSNRVWVKGSYGGSQLLYQYNIDPRDKWRLSFLATKASNILKRAGVMDITLQPSDFGRGTGHILGTCRAGTCDSNSVVDKTGKLHNWDNIYVADGGFFPFPGGVNPTLTIQANSRRIALGILNNGSDQ